jgi:hypothetical protein
MTLDRSAIMRDALRPNTPARNLLNASQIA